MINSHYMDYTLILPVYGVILTYTYTNVFLFKILYRLYFMNSSQVMPFFPVYYRAFIIYVSPFLMVVWPILTLCGMVFKLLWENNM